MNQYQKNVAELEAIALQLDVAVPGKDAYSLNEAQMLDVAIATLAQYGPYAVLQDIIDGEELDSSYSDRWTIRFLEQLHTSWFQSAELIAGAANMLNTPASGSVWQLHYKHALAHAVVQHGSFMSMNASYYGWQDYELNVEKPKVLAVLNVQEDQWGEFEGTFVTSEDEHTGFTAVVILEGNRCRKMRWETNISEAVRELTKLPIQ